MIIKKVILFSLCMLWMGFIFYNSSNNGYISNKRSFNILNDFKHVGQLKVNNNSGGAAAKQSEVPIKIKLKQVFEVPDDKQQRLNLIVRKNAHAFEYCVLAILVSLVLSLVNLKGRNAVIYIMFICLFYAVTDEFHQAFVPGRTSLVSDVLIDFSGSLIGMLLYLFWNFKLKKHS